MLENFNLSGRSKAWQIALFVSLVVASVVIGVLAAGSTPTPLMLATGVAAGMAVLGAFDLLQIFERKQNSLLVWVRCVVLFAPMVVVYGYLLALILGAKSLISGLTVKLGLGSLSKGWALVAQLAVLSGMLATLGTMLLALMRWWLPKENDPAHSSSEKNNAYSATPRSPIKLTHFDDRHAFGKQSSVIDEMPQDAPVSADLADYFDNPSQQPLEDTESTIRDSSDGTADFSPGRMSTKSEVELFWFWDEVAAPMLTDQVDNEQETACSLLEEIKAGGLSHDENFDIWHQINASKMAPENHQTLADSMGASLQLPG